jgi:predicted MPP superfamily phosphohydrolase
MVKKLLALIGALGAALVAWAWRERTSYRLRRVTVPVLAPGQRALRLLHISDLHLTRRDAKLIEFVRSLGDLHPDLVVSTGDSLGDPRALPALARALDPLFRYPGVFVFGSNDYFGPRLKNPLAYFRPPDVRGDGTPLPTGALRQLLLSAGWRDAQEAKFTLDVAGQTVEVRGTSDAHMGDDDYGAVSGPVSPGAALALGVTHAPYTRLLDAMTGDGVGLILAGHTHGGQICLPGHGALVTNCDLDPARASGLSWWEYGDKTAALHVSAGLGTSPLAPVRLACPPEATLLILIPRAGL